MKSFFTNRWVVLIGVVLVAIIIKQLFFEERNIERTNSQVIREDYAINWTSPSEGEILEITQTIVENKISGCGEYYLKAKNDNTKEFVLACTSDGDMYKYYIIWPTTKRITPISDDGIDKPKN